MEKLQGVRNILHMNKICKEDYYATIPETQASNTDMLRYLSLIGFFVLFGTFILTFVLESFHAMQTFYSCMVVFMALMYLVARNLKVGKLHLSLPFLYMMFTMLFTLTIYLSIFFLDDNPASIILVLFSTIPLLVLDKSWRINSFIILAFVIHSVMSFTFKSRGVAISDLINTSICVILGIYVGANIRLTKFKNIRLQKQTRDMAEMDFLTGLYNRRKMYEAIKDSENGEHPIMGVLLFDIDYFKGYNDNYGHQAGDDCLRTLSNYLHDFGAKHQVPFFRFGGEEIICFTYVTCTISKLADQLCQGVYDLNIPYEDVAPGRVTISVGYASAEKVSSSVQKMITAADQALYTAKARGRNRALEYSPDMESIAHCTNCPITYGDKI